MPFNVIGATDPMTTLGAASAVPSASYVQSHVGNVLGVMMYQQTTGRQGAIYSSDWLVTADRPVLTITFTPPSSQVLMVSPEDGWAESMMGGPWVLGGNRQSLPAYRSSTFQREQRPIMEFRLAVPHRSVVQSARLVMTPVGANFPPDPTVEFHKYAGDGVVTGPDAGRPSNLIGVTPPITAVGVRSTTNLSAAYVQSLVGVGTHLGVYGYQPLDERQVVIGGERSRQQVGGPCWSCRTSRLHAARISMGLAACRCRTSSIFWMRTSRRA